MCVIGGLVGRRWTLQVDLHSGAGSLQDDTNSLDLLVIFSDHAVNLGGQLQGSDPHGVRLTLIYQAINFPGNLDHTQANRLQYFCRVWGVQDMFITFQRINPFFQLF